MRKIDDERLSLNRAAYRKALTAAALALRTDEHIDRALMAMPKLRDSLAEMAALAGIGCKPREAASNQQLAHLSRDTQFAETYRTAKGVALSAVKASLKDIEIVEPAEA